jgi:serine protease Do
MKTNTEPSTNHRHVSGTRRGRTLLLLGTIVGLAALLTPAVVEEVSYAVTKGQTRAVREQLAEMSRQDRLSPLFAAVAEAVSPSVVEIRTRQKVSMRRRGMMIPEPFRDQLPEEFRRRFFGPGGPGEDDGRQRHFWRQGQGSGVIVDAEKGYVLTNHHVVADADRVEVVLADGRTFETDWVRSDPLTDVAVVKIDAENLIAAPLGDSDDVTVGHWTLAIGAPSGLAQTITAGIISGVKRSETARGPLGDPRKYRNYIQTDAAINPGNSGGPLVNTRGEVIGINTMIVSRSGMYAGIGLAIPSNMASRIMDQLIETGKVARGYLGVGIQDVDSKGLARSLDLPGTRGVLITKVEPGSAADKAGLTMDDFVVAVDGREVADTDELRNVIASRLPGSKVELTFYRDGKKQTATAQLGELPKNLARTEQLDAPQEPTETHLERFGLTVTTLTADLRQKLGYDENVRGVLIEKVDRDGPTLLRPGLVVTRVNKHTVTTAEEFEKALAAKDAEEGIRLLIVIPNGGRRYVFLEPLEND